MAMNLFALQGRIPTSDKLPFAISNGDDEKKAVFRGMVSVQRSYKKADDKYYPEDLLFFKAFGTTAQFIDKHIKRGDNILLQGEIRKDDDYEKDGQTVRGQMYLHVIPGGIQWQRGNAKAEGEDGEEAAPAKATVAKANPLAKSAGAASSNPLKKGRSVI